MGCGQAKPQPLGLDGTDAPYEDIHFESGNELTGAEMDAAEKPPIISFPSADSVQLGSGTSPNIHSSFSSSIINFDMILISTLLLGRSKVALQPGHSLMDWIRLGKTGVDLVGTGGKSLQVTHQELAKHDKPDDAWIALRGLFFFRLSFSFASRS